MHKLGNRIYSMRPCLRHDKISRTLLYRALCRWLVTSTKFAFVKQKCFNDLMKEATSVRDRLLLFTQSPILSQEFSCRISPETSTSSMLVEFSRHTFCGKTSSKTAEIARGLKRFFVTSQVSIYGKLQRKYSSNELDQSICCSRYVSYVRSG